MYFKKEDFPRAKNDCNLSVKLSRTRKMPSFSGDNEYSICTVYNDVYNSGFYGHSLIIIWRLLVDFVEAKYSDSDDDQAGRERTTRMEGTLIQYDRWKCSQHGH